MDKTKELENILEINNKLIKIKSNNPNDFMNLKINQSKLSKQINYILNYYISGPSIPSI